MSDVKKCQVRRLRLKIPSSIKGLQSTEWDVEITSTGIKTRKVGARQEESYGCSWRTVIGVLMVHGSKRGVPDVDSASHIKKSAGKEI